MSIEIINAILYHQEIDVDYYYTIDNETLFLFDRFEGCFFFFLFFFLFLIRFFQQLKDVLLMTLYAIEVVDLLLPYLNMIINNIEIFLQKKIVFKNPAH